MSSPPYDPYAAVMGWIVVGGLLFAAYAVITLPMAVLGAAMGPPRRDRKGWSVPGLWLVLMTAPAWGPFVWPLNRLGYRVPVLGAPFALGSSRRQAKTRTVRPGRRS